MAITIALDDDIMAALESRAKERHLSVEQFATNILAHAVEDPESDSLEEIVAKIRATPPSSSAIRPATASLADALQNSPTDPNFNLDEWNRQWATIEGENKSLSRANDIAEGRGND